MYQVLALSELAIPHVTTDEMTGKITGILSEIDTFLSGSFYNIAIIALVIAIIALVVSVAIFKSKFAGHALMSIACILVGIVLFASRYEIIGWFKTISSLG
ncbi:MAG: hypothetical protein RR620_08475 [Clostridium sp.]